ncbi:MAG TPA: heavy metal translocating P-type ATPase [Solirubrobacteraceae bacterium]
MPGRDRVAQALAAATGLTIAAGGLLHLLGAPRAGDVVWAATVAVMLVPLSTAVLRSLSRGDVGVDAIALLAMAGCLALGEVLAGAVVALMLSGGNALEETAGRRARRELTALLARAPRIAHRRTDEVITEVPVDAVTAGDVLVVRAGEVVPVDGLVAGGNAVLDESALTGEPLPVRRATGAAVRSGVANAGEAFDLRATRAASESAYAALVRLVRDAEANHAPFVRIADRYAALLLPATLALAGVAWFLSGDPVRALAVLVVATPCPLILAAPIAFVSGVSRAARRGVVVKGAAALEALGRARTVMLDKTGTLTLGAPALERISPADGVGPEELLRLAASVDQLSAHVMAEALVHDAERRGLRLSEPRDVLERPGEGVEGTVQGRRIAVGSLGWLRERGVDVPEGPPAGAGRAHVLVGLDGALGGTIVMADHPRPDAAIAVAGLRAAGASRIALVTGDDRATANEIARGVGIEEVYAECRPDDKLALVRAIQREPGSGPVVMVGDGVNDAPALAAADVGVAMAGLGATVSTETADVVITVDRIERVADALRIGRRSLQIARQSVVAGMGLSLAAMVAAALGHLPPVAGALLQEGIDVAVILNALRALRG